MFYNYKCEDRGRYLWQKQKPNSSARHAGTFRRAILDDARIAASGTLWLKKSKNQKTFRLLRE